MPLSERLNTPISNAELERRWRAVRAAMEKEKIDVLLMQNNNDHMSEGDGRYRQFVEASSDCMKDPTVVEKMASQGAILVGDTPEHFRDFIDSETKKWAKVIADAGVQTEKDK